MKVNCLSCGFKIDLDDAYDDYDGLVKCYVCQAVLAVKSDAGTLKSVLLSEAAAAAQADPRRAYGRPTAQAARPVRE